MEIKDQMIGDYEGVMEDDKKIFTDASANDDTGDC